MTNRDSILAALVATVWGVNFVVIDWGMHGVPPLLFAALRFAVILVPAIFFVRKPDVPWRFIVGVGVFMSLGQFSFLYVSIALGMPPGLAALMMQAQVIFTMLIAAGALREIPASAQFVGAILGSIGLAVVAVGREGHVTLLAFVLCLLAALSWAVGNVISRASGIRGGVGFRDGLGITVWSALVVPVPLLALSLLFDGPAAVGQALLSFSWESVVSTAYSALLSGLAGYAIFNTLLAKYPSSAVVPWVLLAPVAGIAAAWILLGEQPNAAEMLGGATMLLGLFVAQRAGSRRTPVILAVPPQREPVAD
ncbi:O-acetylserine/cysteine efflux transporter [Homoserinimonas aerilata]|uniref:O-acetylserine/cysteine efflux transporter n=1 Tax=Homoserinimonas aerilata TaxID=1162970 RepID=A0A542YLD8_9MICO|nr:EamA family transporter [Homoserinimonas aerilata]TQL48861.1 O-acetylserine/cysteine efflux transporter [Homoserinimonas aerilata]